LIEKCSEYCPLECDSVSYSVSINALPYNTSFTTIKIYSPMKADLAMILVSE